MPRRETIKITGKSVLCGALFQCTKCEKTKAASEFGFRTMANGEIRNQSQCKTCR